MTSSKEDFRVSIESSSDWSHIKANYAQTAKADLRREMAAAGLSNSSTLFQHLDQLIDQTFRLAQPNLRVNGQSFDERGEDDIEPFDEALDRHVWSLHDQRLGLHKTIAATRRAEPLKIEKAMVNSLEQDHRLDALEADSEVEEFDMDVRDDLPGLPPDVEDGLRKACAMAEELSQSIPTQTGRSQSFTKSTATLKKPEWR
ncbi:hypothetical protein D9757_001640 [Collybiopsis confluens]|uniref:Uncharacterized protein n=1 Tax=Collybiopsis confluens TaxID=2823264 RepID=A0A8H5HYD0_9AGAR|nr:hypothetical protein D9757_001640 [Collybiopsis confluens]